jgi:hypothetical protein
MTTANKSSYGIFNGYAPADGPKAMNRTFDFTAQASYTEDLVIEQEMGVIGGIQGVYVDNSANLNALTILFSTGQRLIIPASAQGMWPVISSLQLRYTVSTTIFAGSATIILLDVPTAYTQWGPITVNVPGVVLTPTQGVYTNRGGTITLGGTSQQIMAVNAARKRMIIQNPSSEIESLFMNFTAAANAGNNTSFELMPGGYFDSAFGPVSTEAINVVAATTGHKFVAKEM